MRMTVTTIHTAEELLRMPDDGFRYELVEGELREMSPAGEQPGSIGALILASLLVYVRKHKLGVVYNAETGFRLSQDPDTVRVPDVAFVQTARVVRTRSFFPGAPDLTVEVVSPSDLYSEVVQKTHDYLRAGTRAVIVVDPGKRVVQVHRRSGAQTITTDAVDVLEVEDVVPGWKLALDEIFDAQA